MKTCLSCGLPAMENEGQPSLLLPDHWGWREEPGLPIVCPTCIGLGEQVDEIADMAHN